MAFTGDEDVARSPSPMERQERAVTMERKSVHTTTLKDRPSAFAHEAREKARSAVGSEGDALLNRASRAETAA